MWTNTASALEQLCDDLSTFLEETGDEIEQYKDQLRPEEQRGFVRVREAIEILQGLGFEIEF